MTLRDRQRAYYYRQLDRLFLGLRQKYEHAYGERYFCEVPYAARLHRAFETVCAHHGIATHLPVYEPQATRQLALDW